MKIDINKDFEEAFPNEFFGGFTLKQCVVAAIAFLCAMAVSVAVWHFTGWEIVESTYVGIPVMIPICGLAFYKVQNQTPVQRIKAMLFVSRTRHLTYEAGEWRETRSIFTMKRETKKGRRKQKNHGSH